MGSWGAGWFKGEAGVAGRRMGKGIPGNLAGEVGVVARRGGTERGRGRRGMTGGPALSVSAGARERLSGSCGAGPE